MYLQGHACTWCHAPFITGLPASVEVYSGGAYRPPSPVVSLKKKVANDPVLSHKDGRHRQPARAGIQPPAENFGLNWMLLLAWVKQGTMGDQATVSPFSGLMRRRP